MNPNSPNVSEPLTGDELKIIHIDRKLKVGLVKSDNMKKSIPVILQDWLVEGIMLHDYAHVKRCLNGDLIVTDYTINNEVYGAIHNSYQMELPEAERDYMTNKEGELYE